jgi:DNA-binding MarR family transcriptional regulator
MYEHNALDTRRAMKLSEELGFKKDFSNPSHEALLNVYYAASLARKRSAEFFQSYGVTDVQFNLMMLLRYQGDESGGLSQVELSRMMLVNRANVTALIDRMERAGLVVRASVPGDRRTKSVHLSEEGIGLLLEVEEKYKREVAGIMNALDPGEIRRLVEMLEKIRTNLRNIGPAGKGKFSGSAGTAGG